MKDEIIFFTIIAQTRALHRDRNLETTKRTRRCIGLRASLLKNFGTQGSSLVGVQNRQPHFRRRSCGDRQIVSAESTLGVSEWREQTSKPTINRPTRRLGLVKHIAVQTVRVEDQHLAVRHDHCDHLRMICALDLIH